MVDDYTKLKLDNPDAVWLALVNAIRAVDDDVLDQYEDVHCIMGPILANPWAARAEQVGISINRSPSLGPLIPMQIAARTQALCDYLYTRLVAIWFFPTP